VFDIVDAVIEGDGNYLITVKDNQPTLFDAAKSAFVEAESNGFEGVECYRESDRGHGRIEERTYDAVPVPKESPLREKWQHLETLVMGVYSREVKGKVSREVRYLISDLSSNEVQRLAVVLASIGGSRIVFIGYWM
jgi:hypothetical protein